MDRVYRVPVVARELRILGRPAAPAGRGLASSRQVLWPRLVLRSW